MVDLTMSTEEYPDEVKAKIANAIELLQSIQTSDKPDECSVFMVAALPADEHDVTSNLTLIMGGGSTNSIRLLLSVESATEMLKEALRETLGTTSHWDHLIGARLKQALADIVGEINDSQPEESNRGSNKQRRH